MGVPSGVENLPWLFTGTLLAMLLVNPPYAALVAKLPRLQVHQLHLPLLRGQPAGLLRAAARDRRGAADLGRPRVLHLDVGLQPVRRLGLLGVHGRRLQPRTGQAAVRLHRRRRHGRRACVGSAITASLVSSASARRRCCSCRWCCWRSAVFAMRRLSGIATALQDQRPAGTPKRLADRRQHDGRALARASAAPTCSTSACTCCSTRSPSTVLYFQQADIAARSFTDRAARTAFFARVDLVVNALTLVTQLFLTSRILKALGVALTLSILPLLSVLGFAWLGIDADHCRHRGAAGDAARRQLRHRAADARGAVHRAVARGQVQGQELHRHGRLSPRRPGRRLVVRGARRGSGLALPGIALYVAVPVSAVWLLNAFWLGRRQEKLAQAGELDTPAASRATAS